MVAHAANRNNAKNKRMKAINEGMVSAPDNPKEEGLETALPQKDGTMEYMTLPHLFRSESGQSDQNYRNPLDSGGLFLYVLYTI